jgi:hypothetical protein
MSNINGRCAHDTWLEVSLLNKRLCLATALGVTDFKTVNAMIIVTLSCLGERDRQRHRDR